MRNRFRNYQEEELKVQEILKFFPPVAFDRVHRVEGDVGADGSERSSFVELQSGMVVLLQGNEEELPEDALQILRQCLQFVSIGVVVMGLFPLLPDDIQHADNCHIIKAKDNIGVLDILEVYRHTRLFVRIDIRKRDDIINVMEISMWVVPRPGLRSMLQSDFAINAGGFRLFFSLTVSHVVSCQPHRP